MGHCPSRIGISIAGAITALLLGCAGIPRGEIQYAAKFCEAHPLVGVTQDVSRALAMKRTEWDLLAVEASKRQSRILEQRLMHYSTRWQHLHQSMTTACRDLATCRFRASTAASTECDGLRVRLDDITATGRGFLLELGWNTGLEDDLE